MPSCESQMLVDGVALGSIATMFDPANNNSVISIGD